MDLREYIGETLAGHRALQFPTGDVVACSCRTQAWSFDPISTLMEAQAGYERHVADVLLAALGERPDYAAGVAAGRCRAGGEPRG